MSFPPQSIPLTGAIGTTAPEDVFPTHYDSLGSGGMRTVATLAARNAIPVERRVFGMFVFVIEANSLYVLRNIELGGQSDDLSDNANWKVFAPGGSGATAINHVTESLAAGSFEDFTIAAGDSFHFLSLTASTPSWIRVYGTSAARAADTRTSPGGTPPLAGSEFYAELVTTTAPQAIRLSPVPLVQGTFGNAFVRVKNMDTVSRAIALNFSVIPLEPASEPETLVIYWTESGPAASVEGVTFDEPYVGGDFNYGTEVFQGQLAARIQNSDEGGTYYPVIDEDVFLIGGDDFTLEYFVKTSTASVSGGYVGVTIKDQVNITNTKVVTNFPFGAVDDQFYYKLSTSHQTSEKTIENDFFNGSSADTNVFHHVAIQKVSNTWYVHLNGVSQPFFDGDRTLNFTFVDGVALEIGLGGASGTASLSQIRLSKPAIYGTENFTPPTEPFYIP